MEGISAVEGVLHDRYGARPGYVLLGEGGVEVGRGPCPVEPDARGIILRDVLNAHTHCADYGLEVPEGMSLQELVAPPDGLKHRYLRETPPEVLARSMSRFSADSAAAGSAAFVDFREGGAEGCRLLRGASPDAVILGRPVSPEFDPEEVAEILDVADGIGISSVSDVDPGYVEMVADAVRDAGKMFAVHVSERVREDIDFVLSLDPAFVVHMCEADDDDLCKCAEAEVPVVVCPTSNLHFGKAPPIARAQAQGVDLAIGTDNGMLRTPDVIDEARVFAELAQAQGGDPEGALRALTNLSGKILNANGRFTHPIGTDRLTILLTDSMDAPSALGGAVRRIRV